MRNADEKAVAVLRGSRRPDAEQEKRFAEFLLRTYGREIPLTFEEDKMLNGFTLTVGTDVYDWSLKSRLRQFEEKLKALKSGSDSVIPLMKEAVEDFTPSAEAEETGTVLTVGDEIAVVSGLEHAAYGEILLFSSGVKGMVQDLRRMEAEHCPNPDLPANCFGLLMAGCVWLEGKLDARIERKSCCDIDNLKKEAE